MNRRCGGCTACCEALEVQELEKPERSRCPNQKRMGCAIYADRPESCRNYGCLWIAGVGPKSDRPDKIGFVVSPFGTDEEPVVMLHEVRAGAADTPRAKRYIEVAATRPNTRIVIVRRDGMRNLLDPRSLVRGRS